MGHPNGGKFKKKEKQENKVYFCVKRACVRVVLGWVSSWEVLVLHSFFVIFFATLHRIYNYGVSKWW